MTSLSTHTPHRPLRFGLRALALLFLALVAVAALASLAHAQSGGVDCLKWWQKVIAWYFYGLRGDGLLCWQEL